MSVYVTELAVALEALAPERMVRLGVRLDGPLDVRTDASGDSRLRGRVHLAWLLAFADRDARAAGCAAVHYTNACAPLRSSLPFVLSIHDLSILRRPADHPAARLASVPFVVSAARRARLILTPSQATADEVRRLLHVDPSRLLVIPLAPRQIGAPAPDSSTLARLGLERGRYVLSLGTVEPRKNGVGLLAAFERLAADDPGLRLVFAGRPGWRDRRFRLALASSPVRDRVVLAGYLADGGVAALLDGCAAMAYPSFYEGFGLPVVEAMAAGVPVVTSRVSSLPEAAGGAAVLVDPGDPASIADGLSEAFARRDELVALGLVRAAARTWLDVGRETLAAYDRAIGAPG